MKKKIYLSESELISVIKKMAIISKSKENSVNEQVNDEEEDDSDEFYDDDDFGFESPFCKSCKGTGCKECDGSGMERNSI